MTKSMYTTGDGEKTGGPRETCGPGGERRGISDGEEGRAGEGEGSVEGASEADREESGSRAVEERADQKDGCVYFIETWDGAFVKIGFSTNVPRRYEQIGVLLPRLRLIGHIPASRATEGWLHYKFRGLRDRGEWFRRTEELRAFIAMLGVIEPPEAPAPIKASATTARQHKKAEHRELLRQSREASAARVREREEKKGKWHEMLRQVREIERANNAARRLQRAVNNPPVITVEEAGKLRMEAMSPEERLKHQRSAAEARWDKWRRENPEKAAASEERRRKRRKAGG